MHFTCVSYRHPYCGDSPFPCLSVIPQIRTRQFPRSVRPVVRWSCETASTGPCMLSRGTVEKMSEDDCREAQCLGKWPSCISISSSPRRTIWCSHTCVPIQSRLKPRRHQDLSMCKPHDPSLGTATYQTDRGTVDYNCPCRNTKLPAESGQRNGEGSNHMQVGEIAPRVTPWRWCGVRFP